MMNQAASGLLVPDEKVKSEYPDDNWRSPRYRELHATCPQCGNPDILQTTAGPLGPHNTNDAKCGCGWHGEVHDLVPEGFAEPVRVWRFSFAPKELQALSSHGGDEDWLAEIPKHSSYWYLPWIDSCDRFGACDVSEHEHPTKPGWKVKIGAHA